MLWICCGLYSKATTSPQQIKLAEFGFNVTWSGLPSKSNRFCRGLCATFPPNFVKTDWMVLHNSANSQANADDNDFLDGCNKWRTHCSANSAVAVTAVPRSSLGCLCRAFLERSSTIARDGCLSCVLTPREDWRESWKPASDLARRETANCTALFTTTASVRLTSFLSSTRHLNWTVVPLPTLFRSCTF